MRPSAHASPFANSAGINPRQIGRELEERRRDLNRVRHLLRNDREMAREVNQLLRSLREVDAERLFKDPREVARLKSNIINGLQQLELEISRALLDSPDGRLQLVNTDEIPPRYRRNVEEYYRSLATKKK